MKSTHTVPRKNATALGDGDCAFNAFILGLRNEIHDNPDFLKEAPPKFNNFSLFLPKEYQEWFSFKKYMSETEDLTQLQQTLAGPFRKFSSFLIENEPTNQKKHGAETLSQLQAEFNNFVLKKLDLSSPKMQDDVLVFDYIKRKFEEMYEKDFKQYKGNPSLQAKKSEIEQALTTYQQNQLSSWWLAEKPVSGHAQFLATMKKDRIWAGHLELAPLARFWGAALVVEILNVSKPQYLYTKESFSAKDLFDEGTRQSLIDLHLISKTSADEDKPEEPQYVWEVSSLSDSTDDFRPLALKDKINEKEIETYFIKQLETSKEKKKNFNTVPVSVEFLNFFNEKEIAQLISRQIIVPNKKSSLQSYTFGSFEIATAMRRIKGISDLTTQQKILAARKKAQSAQLTCPTIRLKHVGRNHWNILSTSSGAATAEEKKKPAPPQGKRPQSVLVKDKPTSLPPEEQAFRRSAIETTEYVLKTLAKTAPPEEKQTIRSAIQETKLPSSRQQETLKNTYLRENEFRLPKGVGTTESPRESPPGLSSDLASTTESYILAKGESKSFFVQNGAAKGCTFLTEFTNATFNVKVLDMKSITTFSQDHEGGSIPSQALLEFADKLIFSHVLGLGNSEKQKIYIQTKPNTESNKKLIEAFILICETNELHYQNDTDYRPFTDHNTLSKGVQFLKDHKTAESNMNQFDKPHMAGLKKECEEKLKALKESVKKLKSSGKNTIDLENKINEIEKLHQAGKVDKRTITQLLNDLNTGMPEEDVPMPFCP